MVHCVPPSLSQRNVEHLMKNYIKAFVATGIGMAMMNMVAEPEEKRVKQNKTTICVKVKILFLDWCQGELGSSLDVQFDVKCGLRG